MVPILLLAARIVIAGAASACATLLVGGAIKKVVHDPADECLEAGLRIARGLVGVGAGAITTGASPDAPLAPA